ncbi:type II toxin-antitoxin system HicB family antitoxin [Phormidesmis sp. 146-12]
MKWCGHSRSWVFIDLRKTITAIVQSGEQGGYVAECSEVAVVTQADTLDELVSNLQEAVALHLEDEDTAALGLVEQPALVVTFELLPACAQAQKAFRN